MTVRQGTSRQGATPHSHQYGHICQLGTLQALKVMNYSKRAEHASIISTTDEKTTTNLAKHGHSQH
jgi:hypothetical protein